MAELTIFTAPKAFTNPHIAVIQRNALQSWLHLGVEVLMIGAEAGMAETASELGIRHLLEVKCNPLGTPLVSSIYELARQNSSSPLLAYLNTDILLLPGFVEAALQTAQQVKRFLMVGQRWDVAVEQPLDFSEGWGERLQEQRREKGRLHPPAGSDYFVYPRACFTQVPDFVIGRAGWDNWMIYEGRRQGWAVVDATETISIIHQDHDYSHLPGGQPHYRLPETTQNVLLAGGKRAIFHLMDANYRLVAGSLRPARLGWCKLWREVEIFPLITPANIAGVTLRSMLLAQVFYGIFHPVKAYREFRAWLRKRNSDLE